MNFDEHGEVVNGDNTYEDITWNLRHSGPVLIGWTDEASTHLDILFSLARHQSGNAQGGLRLSDLFVSIMRIGAFGFEVSESYHSPGYITEKLFVGPPDQPTAIKLAELINNVKVKLNAMVGRA